MFSACCCSWLCVADLRQLRHAVDELGDLRAEPFLDVGQAVLGVLGDVVQQRGLDGDRIDAELGEDLGRGDRVRDVRLARGAPLPVVGLDGEVEGRVHRGRVGRRVMLAQRGRGRLAAPRGRPARP